MPKSVKRFDRSNELDTALYKNYIYLLYGCSAMELTTCFIHIVFLNTMCALGIRHLINIMGYVRDIPTVSTSQAYQLCIVTSILLYVMVFLFTDQEDV